jgi:hypothetical protein
MGSGILWAPQDSEDLDGRGLYRQHYPFFAELLYGRDIKGTIGLDHVFSQEEEHAEVDSSGAETRFTPKLRQYILHLGVLLDRALASRLRAHGGLGAGLDWRAYNPGWKDKSYWDKVRLCAIAQAGLDFQLGKKAWLGAGWRSYVVGRRSGERWTRGEFNRMRRMNVFSLTVSYYP